MTDREALQIAYNALRSIDAETPYPIAKHAIKCINAVFNTQAQPEQEPVAWDGECVLGHCGSPDGCDRSGFCRAAPPSKPINFLVNGTRYKVTGLHDSGAIMGLPENLTGQWVALVDATDDKHLQYTAPPSKPWQSLTDDDLANCFVRKGRGLNKNAKFAQLIEAALKEKNT